MAFSICYDAAGSETDPKEPLVVVGLLSNEEGWSLFEHRWRQTLYRFGVKYLHMKDFAHSKEPFTSWKGDEARRAEFLGALASVIRTTMGRAFVVRLVPAVWHEMNAKYDIEDKYEVSPYSAAMVQCMLAAEKILWDAFRPKVAPLHFIEKGDHGQEAIARLANSREWNAPVTILPKRDEYSGEWFHPFSACDFVAYEFYLNWKRQREGSERKKRLSYLALERQLPRTVLEFNAEHFMAQVRERPEVFPLR